VQEDPVTIWQVHNHVAYVEKDRCGFIVVIFMLVKGILSFTEVHEFNTREELEYYMNIEGYRSTDKKLTMTSTDIYEPSVEEGKEMPKVTPGQVWQNGKVVISVQKLDKALSLVHFEIVGKSLRFMSAKAFDDDKKAERHITGLNCILTDKVLSAADEALSVV
jgi:hypothetical protein